MGDAVIERRVDRVRDLLDDLEIVRGRETADEFRERLGAFEADLKAAFDGEDYGVDARSFDARLRELQASQALTDDDAGGDGDG